MTRLRPDSLYRLERAYAYDLTGALVDDTERMRRTHLTPRAHGYSARELDDKQYPISARAWFTEVEFMTGAGPDVLAEVDPP